MTADVAVVTAIYGKYDPLRLYVPQSFYGSVEWVCVTDDPDLVCEGWRIVYEPRRHMHPRMGAKVPRARPDLYTDAPASIWIDAAYEVTSPEFVADVYDRLGSAHWAAFTGHRDCIYTEAMHNRQMPKYNGQELAQHAEHYRRQGHPAGWGLWLTGLIARPHLPILARLGDEWLREMVRWSVQDQISLPPLLRAYGLDVVTLPGDHVVYGNPWLTWHCHPRDHE